MIEDELLRRSELFTQNLLEVINRPLCDRSPRLCASGNFCQISIEHACAVRALSENRMFTSSFVVMRAQFESLLRSVWLFYCATDREIERLTGPLDAEGEQSAKSLAQVQMMLSDLSKTPAAKVPFDAVSEFKDSGWKALNSYTHAGLHALARHTQGYPLELVLGNVRMSNGLAVVAGMQFCLLTGIPNLQRELAPLSERYRDCLPHHRPEPAPTAPAGASRES